MYLTNPGSTAILSIANYSEEANMAKGITTSIRLDPDLRDQLEHAAQVMHRGKNWIINDALKKYLADIHALELVKEAKHQSIIATKADADHDAEWDEAQDTSGWE